MATTLHIVSLGCARNDVDSEELAARFDQAGFALVDQSEQADVVVVNTCGFIESAKTESIDEILAAADHRADGSAPTVVAVGCLAERYGSDLAQSLPEADAVIGFDGYDDIAATVRAVMAGTRVTPPAPTDRRRLLPISPVARASTASGPPAPWMPSQRTRLVGSPSAPLKIASGCDRRCAFCAIPSFRGAFQSRGLDAIRAEATWLASQGGRELFLVSENTTSYGKDLADPHALESLLTGLSDVDGIDWIRLSYLQPAELRPSLIEAIAATDKVVPYFDLPFQHASGSVLRRMRRFGDADSFLGLLDQIRALMPNAGIRSNFIVGFPGETEDDLTQLKQFLGAADFDAVGIFGYSDEEGTSGATLDGHLSEETIAWRAREISELADTLVSLRAFDRIGESVSVMIESVDEQVSGRAEQQGPEDGRCQVVGLSHDEPPRVGHILSATITGGDGVDWVVDSSSGDRTGE
ncbi:MAG: 30S ribosomal protein S12 methylthiotransferase RimO [Propionibacteriaceae bacterium]|jgi:ribosomal protein S12 methylthiotransferase RimO|nr:30S ribosomal protein S12 methylthiotransferase RimO [Propionibacteriaceae bacterium]